MVVVVVVFVVFGGGGGEGRGRGSGSVWYTVSVPGNYTTVYIAGRWPRLHALPHAHGEMELQECAGEAEEQLALAHFGMLEAPKSDIQQIDNN